MTNTRQNIRAFVFGLAAAGFFAGFATPALAQLACGERNLVLKNLAQQSSLLFLNFDGAVDDVRLDISVFNQELPELLGAH